MAGPVPAIRVYNPGLKPLKPGHDGMPDRPTEYVNLFDPWY
jgi:hypothetical protein